MAGRGKGRVLAVGGRLMPTGGEGHDEKARGLRSRDPSVWH